MKLVRVENEKYDGLDILMRVYKNQNPDYWKHEETRDEKEQICGEVLFSQSITEDISDCYFPNKIQAWLPRGIAYQFAVSIATLENYNVVVGVSNELDYQVGVLTSCRENFDGSLIRKLDELKANVDLVDYCKSANDDGAGSTTILSILSRAGLNYKPPSCGCFRGKK